MKRGRDGGSDVEGASSMRTSQLQRQTASRLAFQPASRPSPQQVISGQEPERRVWKAKKGKLKHHEAISKLHRERGWREEYL